MVERDANIEFGELKRELSAITQLRPAEGIEFYRCTNDDERLLCIRQLVHRWIPPEHVAFRDVWQQRGSRIPTDTATTPLVDEVVLRYPLR